MTNNEILKVIEMLNNHEQDKAKEFLKTQLVKTTDKKGYNVLSLAKKILNGADKYRPVLRTIQHTETNEQFALDGFIGIKWKQHENSLDALPQTESGESFKIDQIFANYSHYDLTKDDKLILNNIDKVVDLLMADKIDKKDKKCLVYIFNKYFDLDVIKNVIKIGLAYDKDFENTEFTQTNNEITRPVQIENNNIKALILPCRIIKEDEQNEIKDKTQRIIDLLKGE